MSNKSFSTSAYVKMHTLTAGHCHTVNCLAFSPDGSHLASGGDDRALAIWNALQGRLLYRLLFKSAIDNILWHPVHPDTVIVGCLNGTLLQIHDFSLVRPSGIVLFALRLESLTPFVDAERAQRDQPWRQKYGALPRLRCPHQSPGHRDGRRGPYHEGEYTKYAIRFSRVTALTSTCCRSLLR